MSLTVYGMDKKLFMLLFGTGQKNIFVKKASITVAKYSYPFFFAVYAVGFVISLFLGLRQTAGYVVVPFSVYMINNGLRSFLKRKRPFEELDIEPLLSHKSSPSFPSNHTACAMVISLSFLDAASYCRVPWLYALGIFILISGIFTGLSRVVCGIHYPKDIFLGYFIGVFGYFAGTALLDLLFGIAA